MCAHAGRLTEPGRGPETPPSAVDQPDGVAEPRFALSLPS